MASPKKLRIVDGTTARPLGDFDGEPVTVVHLPKRARLSIIIWKRRVFEFRRDGFYEVRGRVHYAY